LSVQFNKYITIINNYVSCLNFGSGGGTKGFEPKKMVQSSQEPLILH
jgi:hypothetical protein